MIAITGATGQLGHYVIESLMKTVPASQIVAIVRNPAKAQSLTAQGITVRQADYGDEAALTSALQGVEKLLLISSSEVGQRAPQHRNVINAAKAADVKFIAYTSLLHADKSPLGLADEHIETEKMLADSGIVYTLLRNGWYTEKSGGTKITTDTVFSANTTVYAHWTHTGGNNPPVNYYTLRFETGGGSAIPGVRETYNTYIDLTKYVPTRHGYTFVGWYSEQSLVNKVSDLYLTGDRTVYAGWRAVTIPQTGDSGQMNLWSTALCASFAGCVALIVWKIRRREKKSL